MRNFSISDITDTETHSKPSQVSKMKVFPTINRFSISNTFISNARLKLVKNQANAKQHPEAKLLTFENYSHSSSTLSIKNNRTYSKN